MSQPSTDSVVQYGDPLGFKIRAGSQRPSVITGSGSDTFKVEARAMANHQKEAVVSEGETGSVWRIASDEGAAMKGDDLAPFPLGFFCVGVVSDLQNRMLKSATQHGIKLTSLRIHNVHLFGGTGSFIQSTAKAFSEAVNFKIALDGDIQPDAAKQIVQEALDASPAINLLRYPMNKTTFALYINGRRRKVVAHNNSSANDAQDPLLVHKSAPRPLNPDDRSDLIRRTDNLESGDVQTVSMASSDKRTISVNASGNNLGNDGEFESDTWVARAGMRHFKMISDESSADTAPSGLGLISAGIAFCYLTQLQRYIHAQKLDISGARLVQYTPFSSQPNSIPGAIDTHLFLNGAASEETHLNLLTIAANTCFLHAAAATVTEPTVELVVNGQIVG